ncbi:hypothetical protein AB4Z54_73670, partial [Streptomyces sp. MCAF7]
EHGKRPGDHGEQLHVRRPDVVGFVGLIDVTAPDTPRGAARRCRTAPRALDRPTAGPAASRAMGGSPS